jgi:hypothetical protein
MGLLTTKDKFLVHSAERAQTTFVPISRIESTMRCCVCFLTLFATIAFGQSIPDGLLPANDSTVVAGLPAAPSGLSTVLGGEIQKVDLVRDQLELKVPGGRPVQILFDERTQMFQNGKKISVLNVHTEDHASIETTLDGTAIFAVRIHLLSNPPDGRLHGQVVSYNRATGELRLHVTDIKDAVTLRVAPGTPVIRKGPDALAEQDGRTADLVRGTLIDATFRAEKNAPGITTRIELIAVPGAESVFRGSLSFLDLHAGLMSIANPSEINPVDVVFKPSRFEASHDLHPGSSVVVTARFDGNRYIASDIAIE